MKYLKITNTLLLLWLCIGVTLAQSTEDADRLYDDLAYKEVIKLYESKGQLSLEEMERIANGYRLNHDTENAALWFGEVVKEDYNPINFLYYAQALQSNGDYKKAKKYFLRYNELLGAEATDQRGVYLAAAIDRMNDWKEEKEVILKREDAINSESLDFSPVFYKDGIVFVSSRKARNGKKYNWTGENFMNLYYASANKDGELQSVKSFSKMINSEYHEGPVAFNKNFNRIFFTRNDHLNGKVKKNKDGVVKLGIFTAVRNDDGWSEPKSIDFNTVEYEECHPALTADGKYLYFASDREGGQGGMDIYVSEFLAGKWGEPLNLGPNINTPGNDVFPFVHDDGTLYFASDGWGGFGGLDIFSAKKEDKQGWSLATNMGQPYNSRKDDFGFVLNVLGTEGFLNSSRQGGKGKDDIYSFKRNNFGEKLKASGTVRDGKSAIAYYQITNNHYTELTVEKEEAIKILEKLQPEKTIQPAQEENVKEHSETNIPPNYRPEREVSISEPATRSEPSIAPESTPEAKSKTRLPSLNLMVRKEKLSIGDVFELKNLYYSFDKFDINANGAKELDRLIDIMQKYPQMEIELSAHTDARGRDSYNRLLSIKRANGARKYIIDRGIEPNRIIAIGYGETQLLNNCADGVHCEEKYHWMNRRTEVKILKM